MAKTQENERRDSFRIDIKASVELANFDENIPLANDYFRQLESLSLMSEYAAMDQELNGIVERIKDLAAYKSIELIRKQVSILSKMHTAQELASRNLISQTINISEGGCAVNSENDYRLNDKVAIAIVFHPTYFALFTIGTVIDVEKSSNDATKYHLQFDDLTEKQTQQLLKHMFQAQTAQKKQD